MRHLHTDLDAPRVSASHRRATGALARLFGAGLAASIGLTVFGAATSASFAATSSIPDVSPVAIVCPAGMTCTSVQPSGSNSGGTTVDHSTKGHKPPKAPKPEVKPVPKAHAQLREFLDSTASIDGSGVKWH